MRTNHGIAGAMRLSCAALLIGGASTQAAQVIVPPGATVNAASGTLALARSDL